MSILLLCCTLFQIIYPSVSNKNIKIKWIPTVLYACLTLFEILKIPRVSQIHQSPILTILLVVLTIIFYYQPSNKNNP